MSSNWVLVCFHARLVSRKSKLSLNPLLPLHPSVTTPLTQLFVRVDERKTCSQFNKEVEMYVSELEWRTRCTGGTVLVTWNWGCAPPRQRIGWSAVGGFMYHLTIPLAAKGFRNCGVGKPVSRMSENGRPYMGIGIQAGSGSGSGSGSESGYTSIQTYPSITDTCNLFEMHTACWITSSHIWWLLKPPRRQAITICGSLRYTDINMYWIQRYGIACIGKTR